MQIMLGEHDIRVSEGTEQLMKTDTIIWHPRWVKLTSPAAFCVLQRDNNVNIFLIYVFLSYDYQTLDFDIMLIKLFSPAKVTEAVAPISLPTGCPFAGMPCSVSGWGKTSTEEGGGFSAAVLTAGLDYFS